MPDVTVLDGGSILKLIPQTDAARDWVNDHIGEDNGYQPEWPTVIVERRYVGAIIDGMLGDGLEVEF